MIRVVHYVNQFFGGLGGEDKADTPLQAVASAVGPGKALEQHWQGEAQVVATIIGGDNFMSEHPEAGLTEVKAFLQRCRPDLVVAGPAFNAGRYGLACAQVCRLAQETLRLPAVTAMHPENPGVHLPGLHLYTVPSATSVAGMSEVLPRLARLALKVGRGEVVGSARAEGYLPRGLRQNATVPNAADLAGDVRHGHAWRRYAGTRIRARWIPHNLDLQSVFGGRTGGSKPHPAQPRALSSPLGRTKPTARRGATLAPLAHPRRSGDAAAASHRPDGVRARSCIGARAKAVLTRLRYRSSEPSRTGGHRRSSRIETA